MTYAYHMRHEYSSLLPGTLAKYRTRYFVETGTNVGMGIEAALEAGFEQIYSVEADARLALEAKRRFAHLAHVEVIPGSSPAVLHGLVPWLSAPATFYLDAHSIEANPLLEELEAISKSPHRGNVILIDDVRMFDTPDWHWLRKADALAWIDAIDPRYHIRYEDTAHAPGDLMVATL